ncbi:putative NAD-dependent malic enzyme 4 [Halobacillus andaensis]|uniref:NAD-dependent malic enzyme 4 n=1 Tax=Halobacillus andaensis TaxID=1176239 RepID=A0A917BCS1_HALAA|nr:malic enzyme-like NAD(P)-binding protein [Halobacillus andaensis]MBP2006704.1 malate dehydrogenase (oxaloacetate-decarboxylating) [Halobacillus andaensis]GGF35987.1 putative NAD-dependent malic enzyme 4 [Halobacillus andaensis]
MDLRRDALELHQKYRGKLSVEVKVPVESKEDLSLVYSPGVAEPCKEIHENEDAIYDYTIRGNLVGVVTNGTAVLGLGDIGAGASYPVMEGKAALFKLFADVDAFPICIDRKDPDAFIDAVKALETTFGGINLEDISAPNCFYIEEKLKNDLQIPVFHDDQHGTAIVTAAGLINALKVVQKKLEHVKVIINGAGAAGIAVVKLLVNMGVGEIILCDSKGAIYEGRHYRMNPLKEEVAAMTNETRVTGELSEVLEEADVFIGVSVAGAFTKEMVASMNRDPVIFAMANPIPEIMPEEAEKAGVAVMGTGRSDFPNQINNVLAFPGIFKGALSVSAKEINEEMKVAAVEAIASLVDHERLSKDYVIPDPLDDRVVDQVSRAVADAAIQSGVARKTKMTDKVEVKR